MTGLQKIIVSDLRQVCSFLSSTNKTERHNIAEILLKVALSTLTLMKLIFKLSCEDVQFMNLGTKLSERGGGRCQQICFFFLERNSINHQIYTTPIYIYIYISVLLYNLLQILCFTQCSEIFLDFYELESS